MNFHTNRLIFIIRISSISTHISIFKNLHKYFNFLQIEYDVNSVYVYAVVEFITKIKNLLLV